MTDKSAEEEAECIFKKVDMTIPVVSKYKHAMDNPTSFTVSALQQAWIAQTEQDLKTIEAEATSLKARAERAERLVPLVIEILPAIRWFNDMRAGSTCPVTRPRLKELIEDLQAALSEKKEERTK